MYFCTSKASKLRERERAYLDTGKGLRAEVVGVDIQSFSLVSASLVRGLVYSLCRREYLDTGKDLRAEVGVVATPHNNQYRLAPASASVFVLLY